MAEKKVQAIVLAGGFGTRLGPLTDARPKPLVKVLDKSVLELVLDAAKRAEITKITVSLYYKSDMLEAICKRQDEITECKREAQPLGTAGGVKNCHDGESNEILVLPGDAVFDFDLNKILKYHLENKADVTIVTTRKENPTELGNVVCDDEQNVVSFVEKPSWKRVKTDLVNTGIYVLSRAALDEIPDNMQYDFSKNLFPKLLREGRKIKTLTLDDFWCDIGTIDEFYNCNMIACKNEISSVVNSGNNKENLLSMGINADDCSYVSHGAVVGKSVGVSSSVICRNTTLCDNCDVVSSIVGEGTYVGKGTSIGFSIIGEKVSIGENCIVPDGCVIGDNTRISDNTRLKKYTRIPADSAVFKEDESTMDFNKKLNIFKDQGLAAFELKNINNSLSALAMACVAAFQRCGNAQPTAAIMCRKESEFAKSAFASGLQMCGAKIYDCGMGEIAFLRKSSAVLCADFSVYLYTKNDLVLVEVFGKNSQRIGDADERRITKIYGEQTEGKTKMNTLQPHGKILPFPAYDVYEEYIKSVAIKLLCLKSMTGLNVCTKNGVLKSVLSMFDVKLLENSAPAAINIEIENDNVRLRQTNLVVDLNHIIAIVLKNIEVLSSPCVLLGDEAPTILKNMLPKQTEVSDVVLDLTDAYVSVIALLCIISLSGETLEELCDTIPQFEIFTDDYLADVNRAATMEKLSRLYSDTKNTDTDGIRLQMADGNVTVVPNRAKGFKIIAEAVNMETAKELSFKIGEIIKG